MSKARQGAARRGKARTFGQDLMRGEHVMARKQATAAPGGSARPGWQIRAREQPTSGTSIFDPVLCELVYRWFSPPGGLVLDPFAGGSVRGIVASKLGRRYFGVELREEQVAANREQAAAICTEPLPVWHHGDSRGIGQLAGANDADLLFSCPPYAFLEVYSDDPKDLSTLPYDEFRKAYREIIRAACAKLKPDSFACFVVGDVRDKRGDYCQFPWHTIEAFNDAGLRLYNEAVLVTAVGSLSIRVAKQFRVGRKLGKTHQNVFVFVKGDARKATAAIGEVDFSTEAAVPGLNAVLGEQGDLSDRD